MHQSYKSQGLNYSTAILYNYDLGKSPMLYTKIGDYDVWLLCNEDVIEDTNNAPSILNIGNITTIAR